MALRYFGIERGASEETVTQGSSTTSKDVEVVVDLAANMDKGEVLRQVDLIKNRILENIWPPA